MSNYGTEVFWLETLGEIIAISIILYFVWKSFKHKKEVEMGYKYWCSQCKKGFKTLKEANNHKC